MSQPVREGRLTLSRQPSGPDSSIPPSSQTHTQSRSITISNSPQSVFNQKLIPRDYLNRRPRFSSVSQTPSVEGDTYQFKGSQQRKYSESSLQTRICHSQIDPNYLQISEPFQGGSAIPEVDDLRHEGLKTSRTSSADSSHSPTSPAKSRAYKIPEYSPVISGPTRVIMPRTSSIDSAISTVSNVSLQKVAGDIRNPSPASVRNLIATAGGAENLVSHLLKDKNNVASQNAQLWKLVEKQRALLLGLNKDLERITKDRDKYKKRVRDMEAQMGGLARQSSRSPDDGDLIPITQDTRKLLSTSQSGEKETASLDSSDLSYKTKPDIVAMLPLTATGSSERSFAVTSQLTDTSHFDHSQVVQAPASHSSDVENVSAEKSRPEKLQNLSSDNDHTTHTFKVTTPTSKVTTPTSITDQYGKLAQSSRKAPPKPLNLANPKDGSNNIAQSSAKSDLTMIEDEPERGRRRTRAEDDRDRELSAIQSEEASSRSKKEKSVKPAQIQVIEHKASIVAATSGLPLSPRPQHAGLLSPNTTQITIGSLLAGALKSPGLPLSPRPMHNPLPTATLPLSPRMNGSAFPLSPRAPKQPLPVPTNPSAPVDATALQSNQHKMPQTPSPAQLSAQADRLQTHEPATTDPPSIYRGLAVSAYPSLLLPPNALPSIQVRVASSMLRPSRHGMLGAKLQGDAAVFSLSVISRSSNSELWRIEKIPTALPQLEQELKYRCNNLPRQPDRSLFNANSPTALDARRRGIDEYFEELLDIPIDEQAAVIICRFLSTDVLDPDQLVGAPIAAQTENQNQPAGKLSKTGYLTKKGKNFGGWKSRYFVLDGSELRYYESNGGSHLGTIRLQTAQIGKQKFDETAGDDQDSQYRHAFLVQEPKRKDSHTYVRHVLCAESDGERDEWVRVLLNYSDNDHFPEVNASHQGTTNEKFGSIGGSTRNVKDTHANSPTPTSIGSSRDSPPLEPVQHSKPYVANISGPVNGGVITDASQWGNKAAPLTGKDSRDKGYKMSNIFSFKKNEVPVAGHEPKQNKPRILRHNGYVRPVFGASLSDAVEYCSPFNVDVNLPAVVYRSIEYLRFRKAANEEGLFRLSGSNTTVRTLKERFNAEGDIDLIGEDEYHDVHAVASLFKTYLRELPSTLLTRELHIEFVKVLELEPGADKVKAFNLLVHRLPPNNFQLLKTLSQYLLEVTQHADKNKMSVRNMGIVFSPTLNIPTPVLTLFLNDYEAIFEASVDQASNIRTTEVQASQDLTPTDIRSPRQQMFSSLPTPAYNQTSFHGIGLPSNPQDRPGAVNLGEFGFAPLQPSYESGNYVSVPNGHARAPPLVTQVPSEGAFTSLNGLLAPDNAASIKAQRRESAMIALPGPK